MKVILDKMIALDSVIYTGRSVRNKSTCYPRVNTGGTVETTGSSARNQQLEHGDSSTGQPLLNAHFFT